MRDRAVWDHQTCRASPNFQDAFTVRRCSIFPEHFGHRTLTETPVPGRLQDEHVARTAEFRKSRFNDLASDCLTSDADGFDMAHLRAALDLCFPPFFPVPLTFSENREARERFGSQQVCPRAEVQTLTLFRQLRNVNRRGVVHRNNIPSPNIVGVRTLPAVFAPKTPDENRQVRLCQGLVDDLVPRSHNSFIERNDLKISARYEFRRSCPDVFRVVIHRWPRPFARRPLCRQRIVHRAIGPANIVKLGDVRRITLRVSDELYDQLKKAAVDQGTSVNALAIRVLSKQLRADAFMEWQAKIDRSHRATCFTGVPPVKALLSSLDGDERPQVHRQFGDVRPDW
jgi:hypothetical protein